MQIGQELIVSGGATGLLGLVVWLILGGYLVPRRTYNDMKSDRDYFRDALNTAMQQNQQLLQTTRVVDATFRSLNKAPDEGGDSS